MNTITHFLPYVQIVLSILLVLAILFQRAGQGIEGALGGTATQMTLFARRGGEQFLFFATIVIAVILVVSLVIDILI